MCLEVGKLNFLGTRVLLAILQSFKSDILAVTRQLTVCACAVCNGKIRVGGFFDAGEI